MAVEVIEIPLSKREDNRTPDRFVKAQRRFQASDSAGGAFSIRNALLALNMPRVGSPHPDNFNLKATTYEARSISQGTSYVYEVTWDYEFQNPFDPGTDDPDDPTEFRQESTEIESIWVDAWRADGSTVGSGFALTPPQLVPNTGEFVFDAPTGIVTDDIAGNPIDSRGEPTSAAVRVVRKSITINVAGEPPEQLYYLLVGRRNDSDYAGFVTGSLLYVGPDIQQIGPELYQVRHQFVADEFFHARQQVWRLDNNTPSIGKAYGSVIYQFSGYPVYWVHPYPLTANFGLLAIPDA